MKIGALIALVVFVVLMVVYAVGGRVWLKKKPWMDGFFAFVEPIEIALWKKSETILFARFIQISSLIVGSYDSLALMFSGLDLTPITSRVFSFIPEDMRPIAVVVVFYFVGIAISSLRKATNRPLEMVAVPDATAAAPVPLPVQQAMAQVEIANADAVAAITEAKAAKEI